MEQLPWFNYPAASPLSSILTVCLLPSAKTLQVFLRPALLSLKTSWSPRRNKHPEGGVVAKWERYHEVSVIFVTS